MFPQPDDDLMHRALTAETALREAEEQLEQAAALVAKQQEVIQSYRQLGDDLTVRFMALAQQLRLDCPLHGVAHSSHECAAQED